MKKSNSGVGVSKTLVRNCEQTLKQPRPANVLYETEQRNSLQEIGGSAMNIKENDLSQPTLCSSESLANYLADIKKSLPPPLTREEVCDDKEVISERVTKKLNFHFNNKIYKNLVELNSEIPEVKTQRRLSSRTITKRDLEPNIEDFYEDNQEIDIPPQVRVVKPKFKPIRRSDKGYLHKLFAKFDI